MSNRNGRGPLFPNTSPVPLNNALAREEDYPLYDTILLPSGLTSPGERKFFSVPLGQAGSGFTEKKTVDTNLETASKLPQGVIMVADRLGIQITLDYNQQFADTTVMDDIRAIHANVALKFSQLSMQRTYGPIGMYPGGGGQITDLGGIARTTGGGLNTSNGSPSFPAMRRLGTPINLNDGGQFNFTLDIGREFTLLWQWRIQCRLIGTIMRDVTQG